MVVAQKVKEAEITEQDLLLLDVVVCEIEEETQSPNKVSPNSSRPNSLVIKRANTVIPAHLVAEAIATLHEDGVDIRWSGPITPTEMQYVEQYILAKYPQYSSGLLLPSPPTSSSSSLSLINPESPSFVSIPELHARSKALRHLGLSDSDYLAVFAADLSQSLSLVGESYPFVRGTYYLTIIPEAVDGIREFATCKEARVIPAPETWLDLRIKGSQLSQYFRRKCKHVPKGVFAYPAVVAGTRYSMHWISEAHRNSWHVLLDATGVEFGAEQHLALALHRPDFVVCTVEGVGQGQGQTQGKVTCLLVRKQSFFDADALWSAGDAR